MNKWLIVAAAGLILLTSILLPILFQAHSIPPTLAVKDQRVLRFISIIKHVSGFAARLHAVLTNTHPTKSMRFIRENVIGPFLLKVPSSTAGIVEQKLELNGVPGVAFVSASKQQHATNDVLPGLIFLHGGGWAYSSSRVYESVLSEIIQRLNHSIKVISIDYRLVPDFVYPTQFDDCLNAVTEILTNPAKYGLDREKLVIAGDSAGGNLALAVALKLRDKRLLTQKSSTGHQLATLKSQVLIYPQAQALNFLTKSYREGDNAPILPKPAALKFVVDYMGEVYTPETASNFASNRHVSDALKKTAQWNYAAMFNDPLADHAQSKPSEKLTISRVSSKLSDPYLFPFMADNFRDLSKTYIATCEFDVLRDDGYALAKRMQDDQQQVSSSDNNATATTVVLKNEQCFHGSLNFYHNTVSGNELMSTVVDWLRTEFGL